MRSQHTKKCAKYACSQKQGKLRLLHIALWTLPDLRSYCRYGACWVLWYRLSKQLVPMNSWRNGCLGSGKSQLHRNITKISCTSNSCSFYNAFSFTSARLRSCLSLRPTDRSIGVLRPILHICVSHERGLPHKFFQGGEGNVNILQIQLSGCWRCTFTKRFGVSTRLHPKENVPCYDNSNANALCWQP